MKALLLFIFILSSASRAEVLKDVEVTGNKRTTKSAILSHAQIKIGEDITEKRLQEIEEALRRIGQFHLKKSEFTNGVLKIEIEDKWTLFPVPMITQSGNYSNRGVLLYEDNFLGTLGNLAPGVSWSNGHFNALLYYQDESLFSPVTGIKILLLRRTDLTEFKRSGNVVSSLESRYDSILIAPNYLYKNQVIKAGPIFTHKKILDSNARETLRDKSYGLFFRHHFNAFETLEVMYDGLVTTYDIYAIRSEDGKFILRNEADLRWSIPYGNNFFNFNFHGHHVNNKTILFSKIIGGDEGYRGYDKSSLPAIHNFGGMVQYQQHLHKGLFLAPFYEFNETRLINPLMNGKVLYENAAGLGLRYYFKKISIPAVLFDVSRNIEDSSTHFLFNVGMAL